MVQAIVLEEMDQYLNIALDGLVIGSEKGMRQTTDNQETNPDLAPFADRLLPPAEDATSLAKPLLDDRGALWLHRDGPVQRNALGRGPVQRNAEPL